MTIVHHYSALLAIQYVERSGSEEVSFFCPKESLKSFQDYLHGLGIRVLSVNPLISGLKGEGVKIYDIYTDGVSDKESCGVAEAFNSSLR